MIIKLHQLFTQFKDQLSAYSKYCLPLKYLMPNAVRYKAASWFKKYSYLSREDSWKKIFLTFVETYTCTQMLNFCKTTEQHVCSDLPPIKLHLWWDITAVKGSVILGSNQLKNHRKSFNPGVLCFRGESQQWLHLRLLRWDRGRPPGDSVSDQRGGIQCGVPFCLQYEEGEPLL